MMSTVEVISTDQSRAIHFFSCRHVTFNVQLFTDFYCVFISSIQCNNKIKTRYMSRQCYTSVEIPLTYSFHITGLRTVHCYGKIVQCQRSGYNLEKIFKSALSQSPLKNCAAAVVKMRRVDEYSFGVSRKRFN